MLFYNYFKCSLYFNNELQFQLNWPTYTSYIIAHRDHHDAAPLQTFRLTTLICDVHSDTIVFSHPVTMSVAPVRQTLAIVSLRHDHSNTSMFIALTNYIPPTFKTRFTTIAPGPAVFHCAPPTTMDTLAQRAHSKRRLYMHRTNRTHTQETYNPRHQEFAA